MNNLTDFLLKILNTNNIYIVNFIYTIACFLLLKLLLKILNFINKKVSLSEKTLYTINKRNKTILTIIFFIVVLCIWQTNINDFLTIISFISAAITLTLKEIIYNYFCGIYIKISKPIKVEDRIQIDDTIGDVVNLNTLSIELLEVDNNTNQSTGKIIHIPNSKIFSATIKNYNTAFKYIWTELSLSISLDSDLDKAKKILLKTVSDNEIIKEIPKKMQAEIKNSNTEYRIYYNNLTPITYTKILDEKIILTVRFLIHPKKQRNVENMIYETVIKEFKKNNINFA